MNDTSIQFRRRLAQINGIKLNEAVPPSIERKHLDTLLNTPGTRGNTYQDKFDALGSKLPDLMDKIRDERERNITNGQQSFKAHMGHDTALKAYRHYLKNQNSKETK